MFDSYIRKKITIYFKKQVAIFFLFLPLACLVLWLFYRSYFTYSLFLVSFVIFFSMRVILIKTIVNCCKEEAFDSLAKLLVKAGLDSSDGCEVKTLFFKPNVSIFEYILKEPFIFAGYIYLAGEKFAFLANMLEQNLRIGKELSYNGIEIKVETSET